MLKITNGRDLFYQWDIGQSLTLTLAEGETVTSVHIGNDDKNPDGFYVVEPISGIVAVYDELLQSGQRVVAYEYVKSGNDGHTVRKYVFNVAKRPKADNYSYTPTTSYSWEYWCERARLYAVAAEGSKNSAAASVSSIPATMTAWWNAHRSEFKGDAGANGQDGYSPTATVSKVGTTSTITITDKNGTTTASVEDGETQDLTDYVKNTDYATSTKGGVVKSNSRYAYGVTNSGDLIAQLRTIEGYANTDDYAFISKGTLENVLNARDKKFELIEEITLSEDTTSITRSAEPNGTAYNFEAMRIVILANGVTPTQVSHGWIRFNASKPSSEWIYCNLNNLFPSLSNQAIGVATIKNELGYMSAETVGSAVNSATGYAEKYKNSIPYLLTVPKVNINDFYLYNAHLLNGMKIKIYGVRG